MMSGSFPMMALGEVLTKSSERIDLNPDERYRQVTVRLWGKGVVLRDEVNGVDIGASKRFVVRSQQFILSRIDARNGAFGLVPDYLDGAVVSSDFPVFTVDPLQITPKFLEWMSKTHFFVELCKSASEGTTNRVRLKEDRFLATKIPLPPLKEQCRIVARIEELAAKIEEARRLRRQAVEDAEALVISLLSSFFDVGSTIYPVELLGKLCDTASGGTPSRKRPDFYFGDIPWIKSGELKEGLITKSEEHINEAAIVASSAKLFPSGTLLIAMYGATVGRTGILGIDAATNQAICAIFPNESLDRGYVWWFLRCMRPVYLNASFGGAQPNISQKVLRKTKIPVPPLAEQRRIVAYLDKVQAKVDALNDLQIKTTAELDALLPAVLDKAFKAGAAYTSSQK
jgi:type I restriction enzyme S subunit